MAESESNKVPTDKLEKRKQAGLSKFDPVKTEEIISEGEAVLRHATRQEDWPMVERAADRLIEEKVNFVAWWDRHVASAGQPKKNYIRTDIILAPVAEKQTGILTMQVSRWRKKSKDPIKWRDQMLEAAQNTTAAKWTGDPESYTPEKYIIAARDVMGGIDLDPASNAMAQEIVKAAAWFDMDQDGLKQQWTGRVFMNPPYAFPAIDHFITKLIESFNGDVDQAIWLTNNNTDTKWWQRSASVADAVCFTQGRINFYKPDGSVSQPTNGQTFFYFGENGVSFADRFSEFGLILRRYL